MLNETIFNNCATYNPYTLLKAQAKEQYREREFVNDLSIVRLSMFKYNKSKEYEHIDDRTIEQILLSSGQCAFAKHDGQLYVGFAFDGGKKDMNYIGDEISFCALNGTGFKVAKSKCVLGFNNPRREADLSIYRYAHQFAQVDLSQVHNIEYTRIYPLIVTKSRKIAQMVKEFFNSLKIGEPIKITDESLLSSKDSSVEVKNITDINAIDKLQYLSTYHNDLLRRFYTKYGMALSEGMKQAQQSVNEVSQNISNSFVLPIAMLHEREKMCEKLIEMFGGSISVEFTEPWEIEYNKFKANTQLVESEDNNNDNQGLIQ